MMLEEERGVPLDYDKGAEWMQKGMFVINSLFRVDNINMLNALLDPASEKGYPEGQCNLVEDGKGVSMDPH